MVEWEDAAIVLRTVPYGETSLLVHLLTQEHGVWRGLVRGGMSRRQSAIWQVGTILAARWKARLPENLGTFTGEAVRSCAASLMESPLGLALLSSACALCSEALAEKEAHPALFSELVRLLSEVSVSPEAPPIASYIRWEAFLLQALGYGLDLTRCAVTGEREKLIYVSPRTGRAVSENGAGEWRDRLLPLPPFLRDDSEGDPMQWCEGVRLTGYFLERAAFASHHEPLPSARERFVALLERHEEVTGRAGQTLPEHG